MLRPLILIDFDGVFNIVNDLEVARGVWSDVEEIYVPISGGSIRTRVSPTLVSLFSRIVESGLVDVEWLTTWKEDTEQFPAALGFPSLIWHDEPADLPFFPWWKWEVVKTIAEERERGTPVLWIDDDIRHDRDAPVWISENEFVTALSPDSFKGITPAQVQEITTFVERHTGVKID